MTFEDNVVPLAVVNSAYQPDRFPTKEKYNIPPNSMTEFQSPGLTKYFNIHYNRLASHTYQKEWYKTSLLLLKHKQRDLSFLRKLLTF